MRQLKGPLYRCKGEDVAILRPIPKVEWKIEETGDHIYCNNCHYPKKAFCVVKDHVKVMINQRVVPVVDPDGVAILSVDYVMEVVPPLNVHVLAGDLVIRLDRNCQELYIEGSSEDCGRQCIYLTTRSETESIDTNPMPF